jgi:hypothetical protein
MQGFKTETKRIAGHDYKVTQLDAIAGRRAFTRMLKVVGPAFAKLDDGAGEAFTELVDRLGEDDVAHFCDLFAKMTEVSGGDFGERAPQLSDIFGVHFAGRYLEMSQWLIFCFEVNFASFFGGAGGLVRNAVAKAQASG